MKSLIRAIIILAVFSQVVIAQKNTANTLYLDSESPEATLGDVSWIAGHWRGEAFGGITEEIWSPPLGGSMMFSFKLIVEDEVQFYELGTISEEDGTLILRLKHFGPDLKGWEQKDETVDFPLVKVTPDRVYFEGFTFEKIDGDEISLYVVISEEGEEQEVKFNYKRVSKINTQ